MADCDVFVALVVQVDMKSWPQPASEWLVGPLPLKVPSSSKNPRPGSATAADAEGRSSMIDPRGAHLLYIEGVRWHRTLTEPPPGLESCGALELLRVGDTEQGLLVLHCRADVPDPIAWTNAIVFRGVKLDDEDLRRLHVDAVIAPSSRVRQLVHVRADSEEALTSWYPPRLGTGDEEAAALFYLASGNTVESFPVSEAASFDEEQWRLSADWSGMVLRDGMAFIPHTTNGESPFHESGRVYASTIYLDGFLLGFVQLNAATALANRVATVLADAPDAEDAFMLEEALLVFRSRVWWSYLGSRETRVNQILRRVQSQQHVDELVEEITNELADIARFVEAREARQREKLTRAIAVVSAVFLVPSLVFTVSSTLANPSPSLFWSSLGVSVGLGLAAWLVIRRVWSSP